MSCNFFSVGSQGRCASLEKLKNFSPSFSLVSCRLTEMQNTFAANEPVLCIPWTFDTIGEDLVRKTFERLNVGVIDKVAFKRTVNSKGVSGSTIYVYFRNWFRNDSADEMRDRLMARPDNFVTINYNHKGYWRVFADNSRTNAIHNPNISTGEKFYGPKFFSKVPEAKVHETKVNIQKKTETKTKTETKVSTQETKVCIPKFIPKTPPCSPPTTTRKQIKVRNEITAPAKPKRDPTVDAVDELPEETAIYDNLAKNIEEAYKFMTKHQPKKITPQFAKPVPAPKPKPVPISWVDDDDDSDEEGEIIICDEVDELYGDLA